MNSKMKIEEHKIPVREVFDGYVDSAELGVRGYGGKLNIRPAFQREFVYKPAQRDAVIETVRQGFPLNVMYWVRNGEGGFEMLDGQQRTLSICQYVNNEFSIDHHKFENLTKEEQEDILNYELTIYICEGEEREKLKWFEVVNTAGEQLNAQERRNAQYTGKWLYEAKRRFSKTGCAAAAMVTEAINTCGRFQYETNRGASAYILLRNAQNGFGKTVYLTKCIERLSGRDGNGALVNCTDCASFVTSFSNLLGCGLYSSRMAASFETNPYSAIGRAAWTCPLWGWRFGYHEVAWDGISGDGDLVYDACLRYDGDDDPASAPHISQLPVAVQFSDGNPMAPLVYRERLTPDIQQGYWACQSKPQSKIRRQLK